MTGIVHQLPVLDLPFDIFLDERGICLLWYNMSSIAATRTMYRYIVPTTVLVACRTSVVPGCFAGKLVVLRDNIGAR